jgi:hypothetical protein
LRTLIAVPILFLACATYAQDAVEAAASCVVIHEQSEADEDVVTCFENSGLERTAFESGVCQWKTDTQTLNDVQTTTKFVPRCPISYIAYCDRLVLNPQMVAPVKIFLYDKSEDVLERAQAQCLSGGGKWHRNNEETD